MSYDLTVWVKVEGCDKYARIAEPEDYANPTYNLGQMFRACMDWDYRQSEKDESGEWHTCYYRCDKIIDKIERGIKELTFHPEKYRQYEPENGWGRLSGARYSLMALRDCIYEQAEDIPIECLYMTW